MKNTLLIILFGFFSFQGFAQDPQIYNTWYLTEMSVDAAESTIVENIYPPISPTMVINPELHFYGELACNEYMGDFMYHETGNFFTVHNFDATLSLCDYDSHNEFENQFYGYFGANADVIYEVGGTGDEQFLVLEFAPGFELYFQNVPLDLSINDNNINPFKLFPNPTPERLFISSENEIIESLTIYSLTGKKVKEIIKETNSIDVSNLSKGIYFIEISTGTNKSVKKIVKI